jgi:hypothetical protein
MNEWCIVIALIMGSIAVIGLPQRFPRKTAGVYLICGMFCGFFFDHTLSVFPVSFYVVNDTSRFEAMDFLSHVMYGPYSYLFFYLYDFVRIKPRHSLLYILVWAFISMGFERVSVAVGIFQYQHGYKIYYSFAIYLVTLSLWVILHHVLKVYGDKHY